MKQLKRLWKNIPRKIRIFLNSLLILLLIFAAYILLGCPSLTPTQQFRRLEKANLVGPARIIEKDALLNGMYDHFIVAEEDDGVIVYLYHDFEYRWDWGGYFLYREKSEGITVLPAPTHSYFGADAFVIDLPILVFHDHPGAVRAELDLIIDEGMGIVETEWENGGQVQRTYWGKTYHLYADSGVEGYFRFNLHTESESWSIENGQYHGIVLDSEGLALETLCRMMSENRAYLQEYATAVVRLYDEDNALIAAESVTLRSVNGQRYAQENHAE